MSAGRVLSDRAGRLRCPCQRSRRQSRRYSLTATDAASTALSQPATGPRRATYLCIQAEKTTPAATDLPVFSLYV